MSGKNHEEMEYQISERNDQHVCIHKYYSYCVRVVARPCSMSHADIQKYDIKFDQKMLRRLIFSHVVSNAFLDKIQ